MTRTDIWTRSLEALRAKLPGGHYDDLVRSVVCSKVGEGRVTLQVGGRLQRDWIIEHYLELLGLELQAQAGQAVQVELEIVPRAAGPAGRRPRGGPQHGATVAAPPARPVAGGRDAGTRSIADHDPRTSAGPWRESRAPAVQSQPQPQPPPPAWPEPAAPAAPPRAAIGEHELPPRFNTRYTLASFVVGPSNQMAHAACVGVSQTPGRLYNPLFLYGSSGLGKTHLLQAVGHQLLQLDPARQVVYRSTEDFINDFTRSLRNQRMEAFRRFYREQCDLLLLDDVQFISGKEQTQQEFFHTFEALLARGVQIVMTCDRLPREIDRLDERLRSRFTWGLLADIQVPELETRIAIVHQKAEQDGLPLDDEVALFLADNFRSNIRELEGSITRLGAYASFSGRTTITAEFAREVLREHLPRTRPSTIEEAIKLVADAYRIRPADLKGKQRHRNVARPRQVAMYLARAVLGRSYPEIGRAFGKDHTTVIAACRKVEELMRTDGALGGDIDGLKRKLAEG